MYFYFKLIVWYTRKLRGLESVFSILNKFCFWLFINIYKNYLELEIHVVLFRVTKLLSKRTEVTVFFFSPSSSPSFHTHKYKNSKEKEKKNFSQKVQPADVANDTCMLHANPVLLSLDIYIYIYKRRLTVIIPSIQWEIS